MPIHHYEITESHCEDPKLIGLRIDVETMPSAWRIVDQDDLREWCLNIARAVIEGEWTHNYLIEESVHIRLASDSGNVILDTISDRKKHDL